MLATTGIVVLLFALHPVQTETVTYISGRSVSLAALFGLLSFYAYLRSWSVTAVVFMMFACGTKETMLILPLLFVLWRVFLEPRTELVGSWRAAVAENWRWVLPVGFFLLAALAIPRYRGLADTSLSIRSVVENLLSQAHGVGWLGGQLLMP